jgi:thymidine phosphorylase
VGDPVRKGEPLYTIYADFGADFSFALEAAHRDSGFTVT